MCFAVQVERALHHLHGLLMLAGASQMYGCGAQGFGVAVVQFDPELCHVERRLLGAKKLRYPHRSLGNAGVASFAGLMQVVVERNVKAVALACYFGGQQVEERVLAKLAVFNRFGRCLNHLCWWLRRWCRFGQGGAATEQ